NKVVIVSFSATISSAILTNALVFVFVNSLLCLLNVYCVDVSRRVTSLVDDEESGLSIVHGDAYRRACQAHMSRPATGVFQTHNFTSVMAFLLHGQEIQYVHYCYYT